MSADVVAACRQEIDQQRAQGFWSAATARAGDRPVRILVQRNAAALDAFTAILDEHWQTKRAEPSGLGADCCGRCRYGDGVSYAFPCPTVRIIAERLGVPMDGQP